MATQEPNRTHSESKSGESSQNQVSSNVQLGERAVYVAAGSRVDGNIITGDRIVNVLDSTAQQRVRDLRSYFQQLRKFCNTMPLVQLLNHTHDIRLADLYVPLLTQTTMHENELGMLRHLTAQEAVRGSKRSVLLGSPGSGKTSFVHQLCATYAKVQLGEIDVPSDLGRMNPVLMTAWEVVEILPDSAEKPHQPQSDQLKTLLGTFWESKCEAWRLPSLKHILFDWLDNQELLLIIDGLDEVSVAQRARVSEFIDALSFHYDSARLIVTCREQAYTDPIRLSRFDQHTLAPLNQPQIEQFFLKWSKHQPAAMRNTPDAMTLNSLIERVTDTDVIRLASNPLLLIIMTIVYQSNKGLPSKRARLYNEMIDVLLYRWQEWKGSNKIVSDALVLVLQDKTRLRSLLELLAYQLAARQADGKSAELQRGELLMILESELGRLELTGEFLHYISERTGLLSTHNEANRLRTTYRFSHRLFQEYLAGCYLSKRDSLARELKSLADQNDDWSVAVALAMEELVYTQEQHIAGLDLAYALLPRTYAQVGNVWRRLLWSGQMATLLGEGRISADTEPDGGKAYITRLRSMLVGSLTQPTLTVLERRDAGRILARFGDLRLGAVELDNLAFCYVPSGPFMMHAADGNRSVEIAYDYWIAQYPVTNSHFGAFVQANGYQDVTLWSEAQAAGEWFASGQVDSSERRTGPAHDAPQFAFANQPVVGVMWYEALAFTRWLTKVWRASGQLSDEYTVALPSEAEWEKAARGGITLPLERIERTVRDGFSAENSLLTQNPAPNRRFVWGGKWQEEAVCSGFSNFDSPGSVGLFARDRSPYGCIDMLGNVSEWTRDEWSPAPQQRIYDKPTFNHPQDNQAVWRGGSWRDRNTRWLNCASRGRYALNGREDIIGFRVVLVRRKDR